MNRFILFLTLSTSAVLPALSQEPPADKGSAYRDAASSIDEDLRKALDELAQVRATIATEKPAIAAEANRIAADLREKRRQSELARTSKEAAESEFEKAGNDLKVWRDEQVYIESLLLDFQNTQKITAGPGAPPEAPSNDLNVQLDLVDQVIAELGATGRVAVATGEAVAPDGTLTPGTFAKAGPVSWFMALDKSLSGLVMDGPDLRPKTVESGVTVSSIDALIRGESATLALDPTLGLAVELKKSETDFIEHTRQGGFWIYPILLLALIALVSSIIKWLQLSRIREFGASPVQKIVDSLNQGNPDAARTEAITLHHPARKLLERGIAFVEDNPQTSRDDLEEALYEKYLEATPALQRWLPLIAIASVTGPLLGLLGTVTGMMETFRLITVFGSGDAKMLASGIAEALITTEYGLAVAIPSLIMHALLSRKVQGIKSTMEMTSLAFLNGIKTA
ncbi:MAG TPA: MotA/TolQ/ExbB proton channel family protein [Verrucomicrobiales bacterium]|nr:MotA/TolQ/ExbB proton channel family protein [Verrucomicrobiales bacterium]